MEAVISVLSGGEVVALADQPVGRSRQPRAPTGLQRRADEAVAALEPDRMDPEDWGLHDEEA